VVWKGTCIVIEPDLEGKTGTLFVMRRDKDKDEWDHVGDIGKIDFVKKIAEPNPYIIKGFSAFKMLSECNKDIKFYEYEIKVTKVLK
jgi:hypothetical protein